MIDGITFKNPTFESFYPAIKVLLDGTLREVHGAQIPDTFAEFESKYNEIGFISSLHSISQKCLLIRYSIINRIAEDSKKAISNTAIFAEFFIRKYRSLL